MTNTKVIAFMVMLVILAGAIWRMVRGQESYRTVWKTGLVVLVLAFLTDLDSNLGAAISFALLLFFAFRVFGVKAASGATGGSTQSGGGSAGRPTAPSGGGSSQLPSSGTGATLTA